MQENYLAKWLNNELTETELAEFKKTCEFASYQRLLEVSDTLKAPDFDSDEAWMALQNKRVLHSPKVVQLHPFRNFLRVAAAIAIIVVGSYLYLNFRNDTIATQYAENKEVLLPDTSKVILNADSKISYSAKKWDDERSISLEGEAFFKVAKGRRFTVATKDGIVTVFGTQFNVEHRRDFLEVTCFEGLVGVTFNGKETKLPAGTSFLAIKGNVLKASAPEADVPAWMNAESSFKSIPLKYVFDEFERQHNITVKTENIDLEQLYTGTFSNTDKNLALQSISVPSRIKFKLEGNKVLFYVENAP